MSKWTKCRRCSGTGEIEIGKPSDILRHDHCPAKCTGGMTDDPMMDWPYFPLSGSSSVFQAYMDKMRNELTRALSIPPFIYRNL